MSKIVALIPARSGSKGIIDKNIQDVGGRPLLSYSIRAALESNYINDVYVSTDSALYAKIARDYGALAPFLRPGPISGDSADDLSCMLHFLSYLNSTLGGLPDFIVHLRPTTPLRDPEMIDQAVSRFLNNYEATSLRSVHKMSESAYKSVEILSGKLVQSFSHIDDLDLINAPRQKFPGTYQPNGYVDIIRTSYIVSSKRMHGNCVMPFITEHAIEIDAPEDLEYVRFMAQKSPLVSKFFWSEEKANHA